MTDKIAGAKKPVTIDQQQLAQELVEQARAEGVELVGAGGLLTGLTKTVLETALEAEISEHLGYDRHDPAGRNGDNSRNGHRSKTVLTELAPVDIDVPRDRHGSFEPKIVKKRLRRLDSIDEIVLSLTARGLTTGEISAHFADVYGASISKVRACGHFPTEQAALKCLSLVTRSLSAFRPRESRGSRRGVAVRGMW
jgi:transposase-like protein